MQKRLVQKTKSVFVFCENFRPFSDEELRSNAPQVVTCNEYAREVAVSQNIAGKHIDRVFTFDKVSTFDSIRVYLSISLK